MDAILIGVLVVGGFCIWKFIIQPKMNEDKSIEPPKDHKTFGEQMNDKMKKATNLDVDF